MTPDDNTLQQQVQELEKQLERQIKSNELLKKKVSRLVSGNSVAMQDIDLLDQQNTDSEALVDLGSRVKSVFFENVSHEIRSSMHGIVGMTDLVLETALSEDQRKYLEMVGSSVDRLLLVVNEVLDFSRIENGELELEPEDFNLKESLDHNLYVLNQAAEKKGLELSCSVAQDVPTYLHGDPGRLVQIVTNLVNNSIKFTEKGQIAVTIENAGYGKRHEVHVRFTVTDSGCGITPEKLEEINSYFNQKDKPHATLPLSVGTTGLGLTVTSQLVKIMGGTITVESSLDGSRFWFVVPLKEVAVLSDDEAKTNTTVENIKEEPSYVLRGAKILLAEDEYVNRILIETTLKQLGVDVYSVESGAEAVKEACSGDYQLVLMDVQMDDVDGLEATRSIRKYEHKEGGHTAIVALTAQAMPGDREKCLQAGMDDYLSKPVQRGELVEILSTFLTSRALIVGMDPDNQANLITILVESGWQVTIAETHRSALYEVSLSHFDLIVLDFAHAKQDGVQTIKVIRQLEEYSGQQSRIVGLTEVEFDGDISEYGCDSFLKKPVTQDNVMQFIDTQE